jgi:glycyl-tRNA synthetase beta chain
MRDFLLEIGTEEIPASFLPAAARSLEQELTGWFTTNRIRCGAARLFYTPRRLAIRFSGVAEAQEPKSVTVQGPPKKTAFDAGGRPTRTAMGFARTHGKDVTDLEVRTTPKGEYLFVTKTLEPQPTRELLAAALPGIIAQLPFPKNMRWAGQGFRFARPIRWLLALFGAEVVSFPIEDVCSGSVTYGHRGSEPGFSSVVRPADYETVLARLNVMPDPDQRQEDLLRMIHELLAEASPPDGRPVELIPDQELIQETTNVVEAPRPILCRFRPEHLTLPRVVVVTALKKHQRCFSVQDRTGRLLPWFVAVTNTPNCDAAAVRSWYERAAESRFEDAAFFIAEDRKIGLEGFVEQEKSVTWIEGLGTLRDKTERLGRISELLAESLPGVDAQGLQRAALLCKADLLSNMVREKEYTSLQGMIGGIYARLQGDSEVVVRAITEHYAPRSVGDPLPASPEGKLLSIADKLDNLGAAFVAGAIPTGSEDPFALRRQTTGVLGMLLELKVQLDLRVALVRVLDLLGNRDEGLFNRLCAFVRERLGLLLADRGFRFDIASAVLDLSWHCPADALRRAQALAEFRPRPEFEPLVIGQKRVANILRAVSPGKDADPKQLVEPAEVLLYDAAHELGPKLTAAVSELRYRSALELLLALRPAIDRFFDEVLVMSDDRLLAANRLALLNYVKSLFRQVADLSQIVIEAK